MYIYTLTYTYISKTDSLCCIPETNTNQLYFNKKNYFKKMS